MQVVRRRRPRLTIYKRATPVTIYYPTNAQLDVRLVFTIASSLACGKKGLSPTGLPWAAYYVELLLRGYSSKFRKRKSTRLEDEIKRMLFLRSIIVSESIKRLALE